MAKMEAKKTGKKMVVKKTAKKVAKKKPMPAFLMKKMGKKK